MPITRWPMFTGWRPDSTLSVVRCVVVTHRACTLISPTPSSASMVRSGASVPPSWRRQVGVDAAVLLAEQLDVAGAADVGVDRRRPCPRARSPRSGRRRPRARWCGRRAPRGRRRRSGRATSSPAPSRSCPATAAAVVGRLGPLVPSQRSAAVAPARPRSPTRPSRISPPARPKNAPTSSITPMIAEGEGGVRRVGDPAPARSTMPRTPSPSAISASVNQNRIGPRLRGSRGRGAALVRPERPYVGPARGTSGGVRRRSPGRSARPAASGVRGGRRPARAARRRSRRRRPVLAGRADHSTTSAMIASGHGNQKRPTSRRPGPARRCAPTTISATVRLRSSRLNGGLAGRPPPAPAASRRRTGSGRRRRRRRARRTPPAG